MPPVLRAPGLALTITRGSGAAQFSCPSSRTPPVRLADRCTAQRCTKAVTWVSVTPPWAHGMSVPTARVPGMANDIGSMAAAVIDFAEGHDMTVVPAIPGRDSGRTVSLDPDVVDLHGFLELARKLGDGALYLRTETFGLDPETGDTVERIASSPRWIAGSISRDTSRAPSGTSRTSSASRCIRSASLLT